MALEQNLKRVTSATTKQNKDIASAVDDAARLRNQMKLLEAKVEKQRKSISQVEDERDRYLVEATDQARRVTTEYNILHNRFMAILKLK